MNNYLISYNNTDNEINVKFVSDYEFSNRNDGFISFEKEVVKEVINPEVDFEVIRFSHKSFYDNTSIWYKFMFRNELLNTYVNSYVSSNLFLPQECYYNSNSFNKSFFKLDFYDTNNSASQKNYLTIILPTQQGKTEDVNSFLVGDVNEIKIKKPLISLDFIGDKEGYFIYWLKSRDYLNIDTFYMSAKFYDAKRGIFIRMINEEIINLNFNPDNFFYYKVSLNYDDKTYEVTNINTLNRVGLTENNPIQWFEYLG